MVKMLATVFVYMIQFHLVLYWIPLLAGIGMLGSIVWHSLYATSTGSVSSLCCFVMISWWNAGAMFVAPSVLRKNSGIKTIVYCITLPFFVIPAYYKHGSEWFHTATDEILALWRKNVFYLTGMLFCTSIILPLLLFVVCSYSSNGMIDEVMVLKILILSIFTTEFMFFIHVFVGGK